MRFEGLDGRSYTVHSSHYKVVGNRGGRSELSQYHKKARTLVQEIFKGYQILEEMKVQGAQFRNLYLDFFVPTLSLAIEVHGRQHYEFVPFFHKNRRGYIDSRKRDRLKREWCEHNELRLIELKYSDSEEEWRRQLERR